MRFDCGPTWRQKVEALAQWHRWFAWYPVRLGETRDCRWLEWVERRVEIDYYTTFTEYRAMP